MNLTLIDNSHYYLTAPQAKKLCIDGVLPRYGYEKKADPVKLKDVKLGKIDGRLGPTGTWVEFNHCKASDARQVWINRTPLSRWNSKTIKEGWVWCIRFFWA